MRLPRQEAQTNDATRLKLGTDGSERTPGFSQST